MGGLGSGRSVGGKNSEESRRAIRAGIIAAHRIRSSRPKTCQKCGLMTRNLYWCALRDEVDEPGARQWICGQCLAGPMEPLELEMFARSGTSNLGAAQRQEIATEHRRGRDRKKERAG